MKMPIEPTIPDALDRKLTESLPCGRDLDGSFVNRVAEIIHWANEQEVQRRELTQRIDALEEENRELKAHIFELYAEIETYEERLDAANRS
jgi:predicted RNase H-like nuclease (RuvC/YqgF family)